jgi:hypothetical protein
MRSVTRYTYKICGPDVSNLGAHKLSNQETSRWLQIKTLVLLVGQQMTHIQQIYTV